MLSTSMLGKKNPEKENPVEEKEEVNRVQPARREVKLPLISEPEGQPLYEPKFQPDKGPNFNNNLQALNRVQAIASAMRSQNLFDLIHNDALLECPRVWIIGGGPSAKDFDFSLLENEVVIACNRCFELPQATAVVFMDKPFTRYVLDKQLPGNPELSYRLWKSFKGPKIAVTPPGAAICQPDDDPYFVIDSIVRPVRRNVDYIEVFPEPWKCIEHSNNSGLSAFKLALGLGAKEIHLIGIDLKSPSNGVQKWHHKGYPKNKSTDSYFNMAERFDAMAAEVNRAGVRVYNHSPASEVQSYPRVSLPTEQQGHKKPLVVGYFTINTPYEQEIKGMEQSFRFFGFDVETAGVPSRNTWSENCYYKPTFIKRMMEANPNRQIIWADADARMRRYPLELVEFLQKNSKFSIATPFVDWAKINQKMASTRAHSLPECSSAFIVINNTEEAYKIITAWETSCRETMEKFKSGRLRGKDVPVDDRLLEALYYSKKSMARNWFQLPVSYSQIFDLAAKAGVPVVEQMQASRRNKKYINDIMSRDNVSFSEDEFLAAKLSEDYRSYWSNEILRESQQSLNMRAAWRKYIGDQERVLEVGCGAGGLVAELRNSGLFIRGADITLEGVVKYNPDAIENTLMAPAWLMPYPDRHFDHLVSINLLQHIPTHKLDETLDEMFRVCSKRMTHIISQKECALERLSLHRTVNPIEWWKDVIRSREPRGGLYQITVIEAEEF